MRLLVSGGLRIDYLITAEGEVRLRQVGGNALYAAAGARLWEAEVAPLAKVGENYPEAWLEEFPRLGILTDAIQRVPGWQEMRTFYAYVDARTRIDHDPARHFERLGLPLPPDLEGYDHSLFGQLNPLQDPLTLRLADIPPFAASCEAAHIAPQALISQQEVARGLREQGVATITVDPGEYGSTVEDFESIRALCASADAFLPSELEVALLLGEKGAYEAAETFGRWGASLVVIKRGPRGCLLYMREQDRFVEIPAYPSDVVDVTGAGDSFCGGFSAGLQQTGDPVRAALMGTVSASFAIERYGALHTLEVPRQAAEDRLDDLTDDLSL